MIIIRSKSKEKVKSRGSSNAASSSSASESSRRRVDLMRPPSREEDYEGLKRYCHHRLVALRWTSWTEANPGRRFYGCRNYNQDGGCRFSDWHDDELGERANAVIKDLLNVIDKLYDDNKELRRRNDTERVYEEVAKIHAEVKKMKAANEMRESEANKVEIKFKLAMGSLIITWVVLIAFFARLTG